MTTADIRAYMEYIIRVIRTEAYDNTAMETSMDEEYIIYLTTLFTTTIVAVNNPIRHHWTEDCGVATVLDALDELEHRGMLWWRNLALMWRFHRVTWNKCGRINLLSGTEP